MGHIAVGGNCITGIDIGRAVVDLPLGYSFERWVSPPPQTAYNVSFQFSLERFASSEKYCIRCTSFFVHKTVEFVKNFFLINVLVIKIVGKWSVTRRLQEF